MKLVILGIIIYFLILLLIGYSSSRKESKENFLIADRKLSAFGSFASILATKIGGGTLLLAIVYAYLYGYYAFAFFLGGGLGFFLFYLFARNLKKVADKKKFYTLIEYVKYKYSANSAFYLTFLLFLGTILNILIQGIAASKMLELIFGIDYFIALYIIIGIIVLYLMLGGFKAVIYTDIVQLILFVFLFIGISFFISGQAEVSVLEYESIPISLVIAFFVVGVFLPFSGNEFFQRVYATKESEIKKSLLLSLFGYLIVGLILLFFCISVKSVLPDIDPDIALFKVFSIFFEGWFEVLGIVAILSLLMSTADTLMFNGASIFLHDLLEKKNISKKDYRVVFLLIGIILIFFGFIFKEIVDLGVLYGQIYLVVGSVVFYGWIFKLKNISNSFIWVFILTILSLLIFGLDPRVLLIGVIIFPISLGISRVISS